MLVIGQSVNLGYLSQVNEAMEESQRVIDYVREVAEYIKTVDGMVTASQMLERFLFSGSIQYSLIKKLSGGEKRRLYLLRVLMEAPNILILDEPTNDLDIATLTILEDYLQSFEGIVVTVSHDRYFLNKLVNRIFAFEGDGEIHQYEGNYSDYIEKAGTLEEEKGKEKPKQEWKQRNTEKLRFSYQEKKEYETIDEEIARLEEKITKLEQEMEQSATSYGKLSELTKEKEEAEVLLEERMERWVYLNDLAEKIVASGGRI